MAENEVMSYEEFLQRVKTGIVHQEPIRFGELKKNLVGITNTMLTNSLRELEADGLISREQFNEIPPRVEYSFTQKGRDLMPVFYAMMNWGFKYENK